MGLDTPTVSPADHSWYKQEEGWGDLFQHERDAIENAYLKSELAELKGLLKEAYDLFMIIRRLDVQSNISQLIDRIEKYHARLSR
jgi:hypothetical protein